MNGLGREKGKDERWGGAGGGGWAGGGNSHHSANNHWSSLRRLGSEWRPVAKLFAKSLCHPEIHSCHHNIYVFRHVSILLSLLIHYCLWEKYSLISYSQEEVVKEYKTWILYQVKIMSCQSTFQYFIPYIFLQISGSFPIVFFFFPCLNRSINKHCRIGTTGREL